MKKKTEAANKQQLKDRNAFQNCGEQHANVNKRERK